MHFLLVPVKRDTSRQCSAVLPGGKCPGAVGLPAGFGEDDLSKTVEFMIRSYQISDHMTYIRIIYILSPGCSQFPLIKKCLDLASPRFHPSGA